MNDQIGTVIGDRYELTAVIGRGGHGVVYRAVDRQSSRAVAVKMLSESYANEPEYAARLAREQEALLALAGTSAVTVYDFCRAPNDATCLVMELLEGTDLEHVLSEFEAKKELLPLARFAAIMDPIVDTLEVAHDAKILHRDLKPANIFILANGEGVRLFDFGLSRKMSSARLTQVGTVMGSPSYIAPEVWKGRSDDLDTRVDVYSLGVIVFRALSGALPFAGGTLVDSLVQATSAPRPSLHALRPDLPPSVDDWVKRALAVERDDRFETVTSLWNSLFDALRAEPPRRARRAMTDSLVNAWRAAATAFRRFIPTGLATPPSEPRRPTMPPPSRPPDTAHIDDAWTELGDEDLVAAPRAPKIEEIDDGWEEVSEGEIDRPSVFAWEEVSEDEIDRPSVLASIGIFREPAQAPAAAAALATEPQPKTKSKSKKTPRKKKSKPEGKVAAPKASKPRPSKAKKAAAPKAKKAEKPKPSSTKSKTRAAKR